MFRLIAKAPPWVFAGFGKHPCAGDFFRVGAETSIIEGFFAWITLGFSALPENLRTRDDLRWSFWASVPGGKLVIGHVKSSSDRLGRSHPLLLLGEGKPRDGFTANWDLWPFFCEKAWRDLAMITDRTVKTARDVERHLGRVPIPSETIRTCLERRERMKHMELRAPRSPAGSASDFINKMNNVEGLCRMDYFSVHMDAGHPDNVLDSMAKLLCLLKSRTKTEPRAVFVEGGQIPNRLLVFRRSLQPGDVRRLWHVEH